MRRNAQMPRRPGAVALGALAALVAIARPEIAAACAVCFGGSESDWTGAFLAGTMIMLALPPAIIGIAGFTIYRAIKRQEARQAAQSASAVEPIDGPAHPAGAARPAHAK